ncbi:MAG: LysR family transcriptional regulator [Faecousia sp.]
MDINKYRLFADIADTKSFTKSGSRMGYTQPGVSHILKALEAEIGFPLFVRTKQGVFLTPNAKTILPLVRQLLSVSEQLEETVQALNGLETGHLTIAAFASISSNWLPGIISVFEQKHPQIEIELMEGGTDEIVGWVENNIADFGLLSKPHTEALEWITLYEDPLMAILPKSYDGHSGTFPIREMDGKPFILSAEGVDYDIHQALESAGIIPSVHLSCKHDLSIISMVASGLGVSILPRLVIEGSRDRIQALPLDPYCTRKLGIAYRSAAGLTPAAKRFIQTIQETLPELLTEDPADAAFSPLPAANSKE